MSPVVVLSIAGGVAALVWFSRRNRTQSVDRRHSDVATDSGGGGWVPDGGHHGSKSGHSFDHGSSDAGNDFSGSGGDSGGGDSGGGGDGGGGGD